jgi:uncharacterized repeat protein (TIGR03803 family)
MWLESLRRILGFQGKRPATGKRRKIIQLSPFHLGFETLEDRVVPATFVSLHSFTAIGSDGSNPGSGMIINSSGDIFGTTQNGGTHSKGTVFEITPSQGVYTLTTIYNFTGGDDGGGPLAGLVMDASGDLFGTTGGDGANGDGVVYELTPSGGSYTPHTIYTFTGDNNGGGPTGDLILDGSGDLFGVTTYAGANNAGTVFELTPDTEGGYTINTLFAFPFNVGSGLGSLVIDNNGDFFGTTSMGGTHGDGTVFELTPGAGGYTYSILHTFTDGIDGAYPSNSIIIDSSGDLFDSTYTGSNTWGTVFELSPGTTDYTFNTLYSFTGGDNGQLPSGGLVLDGSGDLFGTTSGGIYAGHTNGTVFELTPGSNGYTLNTLHVFTGTDGSYPFDNPVLDSSGDLFGVTVEGGADDDGTVFGVIGQPTPSFGNLSSPAITYGTDSIAITGTLDPSSNGQNVPSGETVQVTLNGITQNAALDSNDNFSTTFDTSTLAASTSPYTIGFSYAGDGNFTIASGSSTLTVNPATPSFSGLSAPTITYGTASTAISGTLDANAGAQLVPGGEMVQVTLDNVTQNATLASNGTFSTIFNTGALTVSSSPYTIGFSYSGDSNFNGTTGSSSIAVTPGPVDPANSLVGTSLSSIQLGGVSTITLQARDAFGNNETTGGLKVTFALENKTGAKGAFSKVIDNKNGTYSSIFTGTLVGDNVITATANSTTVTSTAPINVSGGTVSLAESTASVAASQITAGTTTSVTLQAEYPKNNPEPAGGLTVAFKLGSAIGGQGTFGAVTYEGNGQYTAIFTGTLAGKNTIKGFIDGRAITSAAPSIDVVLGPLNLSKSPVTLSSKSMKAGSTITVTLQPEDAGGNKLNLGENQTVNFSLESGQGTFGPVTPHANGTYTATFNETTTGNYAITAAINTQPVTSTAPIVAVTPAAVSLTKSLVSATQESVQSGSKVTVALQVFDLYGNPVTGNLIVAFKLKGGTGRGTFGKVTYLGNGLYQASFTGTIAGNNTIESTISGTLVASTAAITVAPGPYSLANSKVTVSPPGSVAVLNTITVTLQTKDALGNDLTTDLLLEGVSISFELSNETGGGQGLFNPAVYIGNGEYEATFFATGVGSNTVLALIANSKLTSKAPTVEVT